MAHENGDNWIKSIFIDRDSQQSMVVAVKTNDPKRMEEFMTWTLDDQKLPSEDELTPGQATAREDEGLPFRTFDKVFVFDAHLGLNKLQLEETENGKKVLVRKPFNDEQPQQQQTGSFGNALNKAMERLEAAEGGDIGVAARDVDPHLRSGRCLFIVSNMPEKSTGFTAAVKSWYKDAALYTKDSTVILFDQNPVALLGEDLTKSILSEPPLATDTERRAIIESNCREFDPTGERLVCNAEVVDATKGLNMMETESSILKSIFTLQLLDIECISKVKRDIMKKKGFSDVTKAKHKFDSVGGYENMKEAFRVDVIGPLTTDKEEAANLGVEAPGGILIYGDPGTGKTWFVEALAGELGWNFIEMPPDIRSAEGLYGESEAKLSNWIKLVEECAPCIAFIDEAESIISRRENESGNATDTRLVDIVLRWMSNEERKSTVVLATNFPDMLDAAAIRDGRVDIRLPFIPPGKDAREAILVVQTTKKHKMKLDADVDLTRIADLTEWYTGAELEALMQKAGRRTRRRKGKKVSMDDILESIKTKRIDIDERKAGTEAMLANPLCTDDDLIGGLNVELERRAQEAAAVSGSRAEAVKKKMRK